MRQLTERGQLAMLIRNRGFYEQMRAIHQEEIDRTPDYDIFHSVFYQPDFPGEEYLLELIIEAEEGDILEYRRLGYEELRKSCGPLFDSFSHSLFGFPKSVKSLGMIKSDDLYLKIEIDAKTRDHH